LVINLSLFQNSLSPFSLMQLSLCRDEGRYGKGRGALMEVVRPENFPLSPSNPANFPALSHRERIRANST